MRKFWLFSISLSLIIVLASFRIVWSQEKNAEKISQESSTILTQNSSQTILAAIDDLKKEFVAKETGQNLEKPIGILNVVATLMGVLVGLLTLVIMIATACGLFQFWRWKKVIKKAEQDVKAIRTMRSKAEKAVESSRKEIGGIPPISLTEKPSEEVRKNLDELNRRLEWLEMFGGSLKFEDYISRGYDLFNKQKYDLALKACDKAIELKPDNAQAWYNKGATLGKLERYAEALKSFDKAIELKSDFAPAWFAKGVTLGHLGRHEEALKALDKAIELKPDDILAWDNKGVALGRLGHYEEALKAHNKAIELKPDNALAWSSKGLALIKLGRHEEALKALDKAIELKPDEAPAWYNKACAYSMKNNKPVALENLSRAINLDVKFKEEAKKDEDFKNLWGDGEFKKIVS